LDKELHHLLFEIQKDQYTKVCSTLVLQTEETNHLNGLREKSNLQNHQDYCIILLKLHIVLNLQKKYDLHKGSFGQVFTNHKQTDTS
tara:strand:+ start:10 stop:270 length:261 start_codon:yes stop_codon:yes gene_type:complete